MGCRRHWPGHCGRRRAARAMAHRAGRAAHAVRALRHDGISAHDLFAARAAAAGADSVGVVLTCTTWLRRDALRT